MEKVIAIENPRDDKEAYFEDKPRLFAILLSLIGNLVSLFTLFSFVDNIVCQLTSNIICGSDSSSDLRNLLWAFLAIMLATSFASLSYEFYYYLKFDELPNETRRFRKMISEILEDISSAGSVYPSLFAIFGFINYQTLAGATLSLLSVFVNLLDKRNAKIYPFRRLILFTLLFLYVGILIVLAVSFDLGTYTSSISYELTSLGNRTEYCSNSQSRFSGFNPGRIAELKACQGFHVSSEKGDYIVIGANNTCNDIAIRMLNYSSFKCYGTTPKNLNITASVIHCKNTTLEKVRRFCDVEFSQLP